MNGITKITIGGTISLAAYENIRIEVEGTDTGAVAACLGEILDRFGPDDEEVRARAQSYKKRVFGAPATTKPAPYVNKSQRGDPNRCAKCGRSSSDTPQPKIAFIGGAYQCVECYKAGAVTCTSPLPADALTREAVASIAIDRGPGAQITMCAEEPAAAPVKAVAEPVAEPVAKAKVPKPAPKVKAPTDTGAVCEVCGASLSAAEERTARLFFNRALCKHCLERVNADGEVRS